MIVTVDRLAAVGSEQIVYFTTDIGSAVGVWSDVPPTEGESYDVELDLTEPIVWGVSAHLALKDVYSIGAEHDLIKITGKIVSFEEDGSAILEVAGSVVLLEVVGFPWDVPVFVDLKIKKIALFPTHV